MLNGDLSSPVGIEEASIRCRRSEDGDRSFTVAAIERLHQVGLLTLRRKTCRRTTTLYVDDDQRKLSHHSETNSFTLQGKTRTRGSRHSEVTSERGTDSSTDTSDFVFCLDGLHTKSLVLSKLMEDIRSGSDRIATEEEFKTSLLRSGDKPVSCSLVTIDIEVAAWYRLLRFDAEDAGRSVGISTEVKAVVQRCDVSITELRLLTELTVKELLCGAKRTITDPADEPKSKHVLASEGRLSVEAKVLKTFLHDRRDRSRDDLLSLQSEFFEGIFSQELSLTQVVGGEGVCVDDDDRVLLKVFNTNLKSGRIHRHKNIRILTWSTYRARADLDLISRYTTQGTLWGADLSGEVGECRDGVPRHGGEVREDRPCELHTVPRVTGEADHDVFKGFDRFLFVHSFTTTNYIIRMLARPKPPMGGCVFW